MGARRIISLGFYLFLCLFVSACLKRDKLTWTPTSEPPHESPEVTAKKGSAPAFVRNYDLFSASAGSVKGPGTIAPFGVFLNVRDGSFSRCTATHWTSGVVLTNVHCIDETDTAKDLYLVFWDKSGKEKWTAVTEITGRGFEDGVDALVLKISPEAADQWDVFNGGFLDTSALQGAAIGDNMKTVDIWAMDHHGSSGYYYSYMVKKACRATPRTKFALKADKADGTKVNLSYENEDPVYHLFYDACAPGTIGGNSGSLVTDSVSGEALGVHFSSEKTQSLRKGGYTAVTFVGADGKLTTLSTATDKFVTGTGVAMDYLLTYLHLR